jgi:carbamoyl-phosphate synthase small subunit
MTGYQEIYTDPSYFGQVVVNTTSHIGNYGVLDREQESDFPKISGLVVNSFSNQYSRSQSKESLQSYLEKAGLTGISNVDTRQLVRQIRSQGAMNCIISSEISDPDLLKKELDKIPSMKGLELSSRVTTQKPYFFGTESASTKIAVLDLGIKKSILRNFEERDCYCKVFPAQTSYDEIISWNPDALFISNGPGDPEPMQYAIDTVMQALEENLPIFGICLGHQILALAAGLTTYKLHHGHRGLNHPVKNLITGRSEVTSQNHGFGVTRDSIESSDKVEVTHVNLNDDTIEGIQVKEKKAFSVQYHPEASPGPHDSKYLFDQFIQLIKK